MNEQQLARGLGWFSIGLGLAELLAPKRVAETIGIENRDGLLRSLGARELTSGIGILSGQKRPAWLWSRVVGDAMDLGLLGAALASPRNDRRRLAGAIAAVAGVTALDVLSSLNASRQGNHQRAGRNGTGRLSPEWASAQPVRKSITINRPQEEIYAFWRDFENLPRFMNHLISVSVLDERRSHWVAKAPAGRTVEWDAEIVEEKPNELIVWRSLPGADVRNVGAVVFEPATGGRGTVVRVDLRYDPPGGKVGATIAKLFGEAPEKQIPMDLLRIKNLLETGEIARTEGQSAGRPRSTSRLYDDFVRS
jgi:uncharacterized membrane protein